MIYLGTIILVFVLTIYFGEQPANNSKTSDHNDVVIEPSSVQSSKVIHKKKEEPKSESNPTKPEVLKARPSPNNVSIDKNAILLDATTKQIEALVTIVRAYGYTCDSVITVAPFSFSEGFTLKCNSYRYVYEIENKGGNWVVKVK